MKELLAIGIAMVMAATAAWAQYEPPTTKAGSSNQELTCDVNGKHQKVKSADECKSLGGKVIKSEGQTQL